jgi:GNAT superfamily N-acetyltransferase
MNVATAKVADLNDLLDLVRDYQEEGEDFDVRTDEQITAFLKDILENDSLGTVFIGRTSSGAPIGFLVVYLIPSTYEATRNPTIMDLFVRENMREKGFGRQLFDHSIRWAKEKGFHRIVCTVQNMNMAAQYMFEPYNPDSSGWIQYTLDL